MVFVDCDNNVTTNINMNKEQQKVGTATRPDQGE